MPTFYEVLGVDRKVSADDLKRAYHAKARVLHPDRAALAAQSDRARAEHGMREANEAYEVLSVPARRALYDKCLEAGSDYYSALAAARPESAGEREAREREEAARKKALEEAVALIEVGLRKLDPTARWTRSAQTWGYFDLVAFCQRGPRRSWVLAKVLPRLTPADLPGISTHAEAMIAQAAPGLVLDQYAYLLVGVELGEDARLATEVTALNGSLWNRASTGRKPRALVAYCALAAGRPVVPGAIAPEPDLSRLRIPLSLQEPTRTEPPDRGGPVWREPGTRPPPLETAKPAPRHLLLIDDDPETAQVVTAAFEQADWRIHPVLDLASAKRVLTSMPISVVLLEPSLAPIPGPMVQWLPGCTVLRRRPKIVIASARPERERIAIVAELGADGHVDKSAGPRPLGAAVEAASAAFEAESRPGGRASPGT